MKNYILGNKSIDENLTKLRMSTKALLIWRQVENIMKYSGIRAHHVAELYHNNRAIFSIITFYNSLVSTKLLPPAQICPLSILHRRIPGAHPMPGAHLLKSAGGIHPDHGSWLQNLALMKSQTHKVSSTVGGSADQNPTVRQSIMYLH